MEQNKTKKYERLSLEVISFESKDVLSTSNETESGNTPGWFNGGDGFAVDPF